MLNDLPLGNKTILIIDDDQEIIELLTMFLQLESYSVLSSLTGMKGIEIVDNKDINIDLILLDIGLPDISGHQLCKLIRQRVDTPIIILSANDSVSDKVVCLEYGADDYITKPFENIEMIARIKAILRRVETNKKSMLANETNAVLSFNGISIDLTTRKALIKDKDINLTPKEFELLLYFFKNAGNTLSRDTIIETLWGKNTLYRWSRSLDVHIQNLRQKIEINPKNPSIIQTVSGTGYRIKK